MRDDRRVNKTAAFSSVNKAWSSNPYFFNYYFLKLKYHIYYNFKEMSGPGRSLQN